MRTFATAIGLSIALCCGMMTSAWAEVSPLRFGPEFTFWTFPWDEAIDHEAYYQRQQEYLDRLYERCKAHLVDGQPEGAKFSKRGLTFESPNGWTFLIASDPGVLEVTMEALTAAQFEQYAADMQDAIFVSAANTGIFPSVYGGGGHINIGTAELLENPLLFTNFMIDLWNHNELFMGVFGYDTNNALPYLMLPNRMQQLLEAQLRELAQNPTVQGAVTFASAWNRILSSQDLIADEKYWRTWHPGMGNRASKYFSFNLGHFDPASLLSRIEFRAVRPQASMDVWVRQIRLLQKRVRYLEKLTEPLEIKHRVMVKPSSSDPAVAVQDDFRLNPPVIAKQALQSFYEYVTESGENWNDHRDYLWPQWIQSGELANFEASLASGCEILIRGRGKKSR